MTTWAPTTGDIMASSGGDGGSVGLIFFLSGFIFYAVMFLKYRNTNKRHMHAKETEATLDNVVAGDEYLGERKRLQSTSIDGGNERQVEGAQNANLMTTLISGAVSSSALGRMMRR